MCLRHLRLVGGRIVVDLFCGAQDVRLGDNQTISSNLDSKATQGGLSRISTATTVRSLRNRGANLSRGWREFVRRPVIYSPASSGGSWANSLRRTAE